MTKITEIGRDLKITTGGDNKIYSKCDIKNHSHDHFVQCGFEGGISFNNPEKPPVVDEYFINGSWTLDREGKKHITSAIPGMLVYFQLETKNIKDYERVYLTMMEYDNNVKRVSGRSGDIALPLFSTTDSSATKSQLVKDNRVTLPVHLTNLENWLSKEKDIRLQFYFRCSYLQQNSSYPSRINDYLRFKKIVVDRYKVPGLDWEGNDLASDLTYGIGGTPKTQILNSNFRNRGIADYTENLVIDKSFLRTVSNNDKLSNEYSSKYSKEQIYNTKYGDTNTGDHTKSINDFYTDDGLFSLFEGNASALFSNNIYGRVNNLEGNTRRMIAFFKKNEGGIYVDKELDEAIKNNSVTVDYCQRLENYLKDKIFQNVYDLHKIESKIPDLGTSDQIKISRTSKGKKFSRPIYNEVHNRFGGLTIALNDIWATQVTILELTNNEGKNYTCKYEVILWDHFGLDLPDMEKDFNVNLVTRDVFAAWFVLQHLRGYKPFITKIVFEKEFKGTF